jgi:predicted MPP superfamily phosphohydrolase
MDSLLALLIFGFLVAWVGHACIWTSLLNHVYGRPFSKAFLRPWRLTTGIIIVAFPLLVPMVTRPADLVSEGLPRSLGVWGWLALVYIGVGLVFGGVILPAITLYRLLRPRAPALTAERTETVDFRVGGADVFGSGKWAWIARLPRNDVYRVDFTDLTLTLPDLPPAWDGLTILLLSDLHFHGIPGRGFFDRVIDRIVAAPPTDLVCLVGDYLDSDEHRAWIGPVLGRLTATGEKFAILGNHDEHYNPEDVRADLVAAGYRVIGNGWTEATVRGERFVVVGHEGPWFVPPPDLSDAPPGQFRLCLSHTPDNIYWGRKNGIRLMLCGHVHGGQIRVPVIGPIFIPSVYGRRFDSGVFEGGGTVMVVGRGLSGKEPLRFRCPPQVVRITLRPR